MEELWVCPKCKRKFEKKNQVHSCTIYPVEKHFEGKGEVARSLYNELEERIKKDIGPFNVESLPCCIHFVGTYTFTAVYALKNKIRIHFPLDYELRSPRINKYSQVSKSARARYRYMYSIDIDKKDEIDKELVDWLQQAYSLKTKMK
jgi:hypothetical protein